MGALDDCGAAWPGAPANAPPCVPTIVLSDRSTAVADVVVAPAGATLDLDRLKGVNVAAAECVTTAVGQGGQNSSACTAAVVTTVSVERDAIYLQNQGWGLWHFAFGSIVLLVLIVQILGLWIKPF